MHAAACAIVAWAMLAGCAITLEDLKGMPRGWIRFNKRMRTRLNASAMMKFHRLIWETARWNGIEVLVMHSRNTSARCWMCRTRLSGGYHLRKCMRCMVCVDRDVNAALNMLRTIAAVRYGHVVRPSLDEARFLQDIMLDPGRVVREGGSLRVDGEFAGAGWCPALMRKNRHYTKFLYKRAVWLVRDLRPAIRGSACLNGMDAGATRS